MGSLSVRELNDNLSAAIARVEAGEVLTVTKYGKPVIEMRPRPARKQDTPEWQAAYKRMIEGMSQGLEIGGRASYEERTE